jgi:hypothetical protein
VADFSSRGPTKDGRTKPDVLAPGKAILSAGALPDQVGECDPAHYPLPYGSGAGVTSKEGTSMAAPVVSGTAALMRQYFAEGYYPTGEATPSNAMPNVSGTLIKAILMNGGQFVTAVDNGACTTFDVAPYDQVQNMGRISLSDSLYLKGFNSSTTIDIAQAKVYDRHTISNKGTRTYKVTIHSETLLQQSCASKEFRVSLVWNDAGSPSGCANCVMNDLDLSVSKISSDSNGGGGGDSGGASFYYPNGQRTADGKNNAERIIVPSEDLVPGDSLVVSVHAYNLVGAAQQYALVMTGCFDAANEDEDEPNDVNGNGNDQHDEPNINSNTNTMAFFPSPFTQEDSVFYQDDSYKSLCIFKNNEKLNYILIIAIPVVIGGFLAAICVGCCHKARNARLRRHRARRGMEQRAGAQDAGRRSIWQARSA